MTCSACGSANEAGRKFCGQCGERLAIACPACGTPNPPTDRFCGECGVAIEGRLAVAASAPAAVGTPHAPVAERRLVTVLFADLVGFTPFAEARDVEEVRDTLARYFELASELIGRYGGTVEKFIGDAVMAVWGAPTAGEDDAERAVRAGLDVVDAVRSLGPGIEARAGLATGEAAVTLGAAGQGMVAGDLVNTASRLQSVATPGAVLVGEVTMRAASRAIAFEPAGEHVLKGKAASVPAWRALRVVAEVGGRGRPDMLEPPFVGRAEELRALKDALHATGRERRPRLVSVSGVAGIGKSRLAWELLKYIDGLAETVWWHAGRSPAHGEGVASWALGEMVRGRAGLAEGDDEPTTRAAVGRLLDEWVPDAEDRRWIEPALLALLGLESPAPGGRDVLFAGWRMLFERIAARGTTVLVFEDLQWADDGLLDFIERLLEVARNAPILVVTLARPELIDRRPGWGATAHAATSLALEPLGTEETRRLVLGLVPDLPERVVAAIVERAAGVPLYAVETIRMLIVDGKLEPAAGGTWRPVGEMGELAVPETLRSLVAARLDALDPTDRRLLSDAAVLGGSFSLDDLAAVSGLSPETLEPRLRGLVRRELLGLQTDPRSPERGKYAFVQALVREVAYATMARRDRRARHLAAARHLLSLGNEELAGALAAHFLAAYRASAEGPEADALATQARVTLTGAARRALDLGAYEQAIDCVEQALPLPQAPGDGATLLEIASRAASQAGKQDVAEDYARRAIAAREGAGDPVATARATALLAVVLQRAGRVGAAIPLIEAALGHRPVDGAGEADAVLLAYLSRVYILTGQDEPCLATADRALAIAERLDLDDLVAEVLDNKALALNDLGRRREAVALMEGALRLARAHGDADAESRATNNLSYVLAHDDVRRALASDRRYLERLRRLGGLPSILIATWNLAEMHIESAVDWDEAERLIAELAAVTTEARARADLEDGNPLVRAARRELDDERFAARETRVRDLADPQASATFELERAEVEWCRGDFGAVVRAGLAAAQLRGKALEGLGLAGWGALWLRDAVGLRAIVERLEADPETSRLAKATRAACRGSLAGLEGRPAESVARSREAIRTLREGGFEWRAALAALGLLWAVGPGVAEARAAAEEARAVFERVRARVHLERLEAAMAQTVAEAPA